MWKQVHCLFIFRVSWGVAVNVLFTYSASNGSALFIFPIEWIARPSIDMFISTYNWNTIEIMLRACLGKCFSVAEPLSPLQYRNLVQQIMFERLYFRNWNNDRRFYKRTLIAPFVFWCLSLSCCLNNSVCWIIFNEYKQLCLQNVRNIKHTWSTSST